MKPLKLSICLSTALLAVAVLRAEEPTPAPTKQEGGFVWNEETLKSTSPERTERAKRRVQEYLDEVRKIPLDQQRGTEYADRYMDLLEMLNEEMVKDSWEEIRKLDYSDILAPDAEGWKALKTRRLEQSKMLDTMIEAERKRVEKWEEERREDAGDSYRSRSTYKQLEADRKEARKELERLQQERKRCYEQIEMVGAELDRMDDMRREERDRLAKEHRDAIALGKRTRFKDESEIRESNLVLPRVPLAKYLRIKQEHAESLKGRLEEEPIEQ